ncbi:MAG: 3-dehydroquinate synthase [Thermoleophilia bacterium]|nr:3-dehydroquinate synthase [Thermoleophilia bacterium]
MAAVVALAGFMGAGKTSVGEMLASSLGWRFVDLDTEFERRHPEGIARFFAEKGEAAFRAEEWRLLRTILEDACFANREESEGEGLVLSLGGGTLEIQEAAEALEQCATVFYLKISPETAWRRVQGSDRPLAQDQAVFLDRFFRRQELYEDAADWVIPADNRSVGEIVEDILWVVKDARASTAGSWGRFVVLTQRRSRIMGAAGALLATPQLAKPFTAQGQRIFLITDENVFWAWGSRLLSCLGQQSRVATLIVAQGEQSKSVRTLASCWEWLAEQGARRDDLVVALGGGVVGDLAGFAAATYQRGVPLWQIPTTLLAQVDSSVGGKTAVNLPAGKNLVGAFYQPDLVVIDPVTLDTLPTHVYRAGLAEVVKYALLKSWSFFSFLERNASQILAREPYVLARLVKRCVLCKAEIVEQDETEMGPRAVLNLGHTVAHALEKVVGYGKLSHGEAVSLGLVAALVVSEKLLGLDPEVRMRTTCLLETFGLPVSWEISNIDAITAATAYDKKARARSAGYVGLQQVGQPVIGLDVSPSLLREALEVITR